MSMKKQIKELQEIMEKIEDISDKLDDICAEIEDLEDNKIKNVDIFTLELERQGLMTEELENFIENYMRWDNEE